MSANIGHACAISCGKDGACADQAIFLEAPAQALDRDEGLRRIQRHFDQLKAGVDQCLDNGLHLNRTNAPQNRDERALYLWPGNLLDHVKTALPKCWWRPCGDR